MVYDLILADGTIVRTTASGVGQQGDLWIHAVDMSFMDCVNTFSNPEKTKYMRVNYSESILDEFKGYTELFSISAGTDFIKIGLAKGNDQNEQDGSAD